MENNKYYTPTIEEFYVGFEYEVKKEDSWFRCFYDQGSIVDLYYNYNDDFDSIDFNKETIRVKYLDKENIESLGFEYSANYADLPELGFLKDTNYLSPYTQYLLYYNTINQQLRIERIVNCGTGKEDYLFNGKIKNKSELKKLLKQLGI